MADPDLSMLIEKLNELRERLIALGWTPPDEPVQDETPS